MASMTTDHTPGDTGAGAPKRPCALLWDESHLWGVMARRALGEAGLPYDLLRSEDIRGGALSRYRMIFVPGGWASNKLGALGQEGSEEIRRFVAVGGCYLGICGGAGMATEGGLGLLPVRRRPSKERVPSFSGPIRLSCGEHALWQDIETSVFSAWWPSQFLVADRDVRVLARYEEAQADAFSSDFNVADGGVVGWPDLERRYGILLDPARLRGEPGVVEGSFGSGRVVLSLVHFDTPGDRSGAVVLRNLWRHLASCSPCHPPTGGGVERGASLRDVPQEALQSLEEIRAAVADLIAGGTRNFLWYWRNPLLLQWRRGVRGLEYSTLAVMVGEVVACLRSPDTLDPDGRRVLPRSIGPSRLREDLREIREQLVPFCEKAKRLLVRERLAMMAAPLSPVECADREISSLREELFASAMSHGGLFKGLIDRVDRLLYDLIRGE
jgi:putative intracellular protease/amidase